MQEAATVLPWENLVGFKVVPYFEKEGVFRSPQQKDFRWNGLVVTGICVLDWKTPEDQRHPAGSEFRVSDPSEECWCGIHVAYSPLTAYYYCDHPISPMFIVEQSGVFTPYLKGFRTQQATLRAVVLPNPDYNYYNSLPTTQRLEARSNSTVKASYIAAEYFGLPILQFEEALYIVDLWNVQLRPDLYTLQVPELAELNLQDPSTFKAMAERVLFNF